MIYMHCTTCNRRKSWNSDPFCLWCRLYFYRRHPQLFEIESVRLQAWLKTWEEDSHPILSQEMP